MKTRLKKNENVFLTIRKHWFVLLKPILLSSMLLIVAITIYNYELGRFFLIGAGLTIIWSIYRILERNTNLWAVTNLRIIDECGLFINHSIETSLDKIHNISYRQSRLGRMFNFGDVEIQSATEFGSTIYEMVERPKLLKDTITQYHEQYKQEKIKKQAQSLAQVVSAQKPSIGVDLPEELRELHALKVAGIITEDDYQWIKNKILNN